MKLWRYFVYVYIYVGFGIKKFRERKKLYTGVLKPYFIYTRSRKNFYSRISDLGVWFEKLFNYNLCNKLDRCAKCERENSIVECFIMSKHVMIIRAALSAIFSALIVKNANSPMASLRER